MNVGVAHARLTGIFNAAHNRSKDEARQSCTPDSTRYDETTAWAQHKQDQQTAA
jgi:hypothetical protein